MRKRRQMRRRREAWSVSGRGLPSFQGAVIPTQSVLTRSSFDLPAPWVWISCDAAAHDLTRKRVADWMGLPQQATARGETDLDRSWRLVDPQGDDVGLVRARSDRDLGQSPTALRSSGRSTSGSRRIGLPRSTACSRGTTSRSSGCRYRMSLPAPSRTLP